jgi:hypothetical protein
LKKNKYHIILSWLLLLVFSAGQYVVYAHTHRTYSGKISSRNQAPQPKQTISENCQLCDAMHHNAMAANSQVHFSPVVVSLYAYKHVEYGFISISLILSSGRAPPLA